MFVFPSGKLDSSDYEIERSLRFNSADSAYLSRTVGTSSATDRQKFTIRRMIKLCVSGTINDFATSRDDGSSRGNAFSIRFSADNTILIYNYCSGYQINLITSAVYRDVAGWYDILLAIDTTQTTASDRVKLYVNGKQIIAFTTATYPAQNTQLNYNDTGHVQYIGWHNATNVYANYYCAEAIDVYGQALDPSSFGYTDPNTHQWKPKAYTGSYGTNGFYLDFSDNTSTTTLGYDRSGNGNNWTLNNFSVAAGAGNDSLLDTPTNNFATLNAIYTGKSTLSNSNLTASGTTDLPTIMPDSGTWYFEISDVSKTWTPPAAFPAAAGNYNFGQRSFANTATYPTLCTKNLPTPTGAAAKPWEHFNINLATGANIKSACEDDFTYFLEWIKDRANANNHQLIDTVRGTSAVLQSNTTAAETTYTTPSGSSVGWVFNAGNAAVTNTDGSITSQVSANTAAGFSVVTATLAGANTTIGHGLGVAPKMVIGFNRGGGTHPVYHANLTSAAYVLYLEQTAAQASIATIWNSTAPTSSVFSTGTGLTGNWVFYSFAEIPGYSKIGSYTGNSSADGPFVYCGFRPRWVLVKSIDYDGTQAWFINDAARSSYNVTAQTLCPNLNNAELNNATYYAIDFVSNGFKVRCNSTGLNFSGKTHIFMAISESPFKYSNAR